MQPETTTPQHAHHGGQEGHPAPPRPPRPPQRGMTLGIRLGLFTALIVTGVMGVTSGTQLLGEQRAAAVQRQALLAESLSPLVADLQEVGSPQEAATLVDRYHQSYVDLGHGSHQLSLVTAEGTLVTQAGGFAAPEARQMLRAQRSLSNARLSDDPLLLMVRQDGSATAAAERRRWRGWVFHIMSTALVTLALLALVIRHEVTGPVERLLRGIGKMELGYWDDLPDPGGAWEIRVVAWRFRALGQELGQTVEQLLSAQQRAVGVGRGATVDPDWLAQQAPADQRSMWTPDRKAVTADLEGILQRLEAGDPTDPQTRTEAEAAWTRHAGRAERLGLMSLHNAIENASLRILEPDGYANTARLLTAEGPGLERRANDRSTELQRVLGSRGVPVVSVSSRVKHPAGVWRKMAQKDLTLNQVHDLVALRVVVPTATDCYLVLGVLHELYSPIASRFKDYIASPKGNGYRSLHSTVRDSSGAIFEVQIRSSAMHREAEHGEADHERYRKTNSVSPRSVRPSRWQRMLQMTGLA